MRIRSQRGGNGHDLGDRQRAEERSRYHSFPGCNRRNQRLLKMMGLEVKLNAGYAHNSRKLIQILLQKDFSLPKAEIVAEASSKNNQELGESKRGGKNLDEPRPKVK